MLSRNVRLLLCLEFNLPKWLLLNHLIMTSDKCSDNLLVTFVFLRLLTSRNMTISSFHICGISYCLHKWVHPWCSALNNVPSTIPSSARSWASFSCLSTSYVINCIFSVGAAVKQLPVLQRTTTWPGDGPCRWWSAPSWPSLDSRVRRRQRWRRWRRWCRAVCSHPSIQAFGLIITIFL